LANQSSTEKKPKNMLLSGGRLAARFRRMNILIFAAAFCVIAAMILVLLNSVIAMISAEYAQQNALSSAESLSVRINREIDLVSQIARSDAVIEWSMDEGSEYKMELAIKEMTDKVPELYSYNLYIGLEGSRNQYRVIVENAVGSAMHIDVLSQYEPNDAWYFKSIGADRVYTLDIAIDRELQRKRVWIDYNVMRDDVPLGVLSTGLEFSHVVGELFTHYSSGNMRGLIIDEDGVIHMDSALIYDREFLFSEFMVPIDEEFSNTELLAAIELHMRNNEGYSSETGVPAATKLSSGPYRNVTIMPIRETNWSVVILSGSVSLFNISYFVPILITVLVLLIVVAFVTSAANYRLIFLPLGKLDQSLTSLRENSEGYVYGADRDDELGDLSKTIQDLFAKANIDALTGVYNRRFMENNLEKSMEMLSRSSGLLSVLMVDIDFFKKYNDTYGHGQGDVCLREVARATSSGIMRLNDFTARYGGEEFAAILPNTDENGARIVAEKLLNRVQELKIPHSDSTVAPYVTVSIGVTTGRVAYGQSWKDYIKRADDALYMSKRNGRNQYTFLEM